MARFRTRSRSGWRTGRSGVREVRLDDGEAVSEVGLVGHLGKGSDDGRVAALRVKQVNVRVQSDLREVGSSPK